MPQSAHGVARRAKRDEWRSQPRQARGGGVEFCISSLPTETQKALTDHVVSGSGDLSPERIAELDEIATEVGAPDLQVRAPLTEDERDAAWANFEGRSKASKAKALRKVLCLKAVQKLMADNIGRTAAVNVIAPQFGFSATTIFKDFSTVRGRGPVTGPRFWWVISQAVSDGQNSMTKRGNSSGITGSRSRVHPLQRSLKARD